MNAKITFKLWNDVIKNNNNRKKNLIFVVETLNINLKRSKFRVLIISISIKIFVTQINRTIIICLIDFDVETNFIFQRLIKKMQLFEFKKIAKQQINAIDDRVVQMYEHYENMFIKTHDNEKRFEKQNVDFWTIDMLKYDMIFEYFWLNVVNFDIDWHNRRWIYRDNNYKKFK